MPVMPSRVPSVGYFDMKALPILLTVLLTLMGCVQQRPGVLNVREEFTICLASVGEGMKIKERVLEFAHQNKMDVYDRSAQLERELRDLRDAAIVLEATTGKIIMLTVEKKNSMRVSLTNAGSGYEMGLTIRYHSQPRPRVLDILIDGLKREHHVFNQDQGRCPKNP